MNRILTASADYRDHNNQLGTTSIEDGTATPPPEEEINTAAAQPGAAFEMSKIPKPMGMETSANNNNNTVAALTDPSSAGYPRKTMGLSLQIVNPESLGVSHEEIVGRKKDGQLSPVTPWEGQLKALVRYVSYVDEALELHAAPNLI